MLGQAVEFGFAQQTLNKNDGITYITAFDKVVVDKEFKVVQKYKCAAISNFFPEVFDVGDGSILSSKNPGFKINHYRKPEIIVRYKYHFALSLGIGKCKGVPELEIFAYSIQFNDSCSIKGSHKKACTAIHDRHFLIVNFYHNIVDAQTGNRSEYVFDCNKSYSIIFNSCSTRSIYNVISYCVNYRLAFKIDTTEFYAMISRSWFES